MKAKVVKSLLMSVIGMTFASLCISFAWFTAVRMKMIDQDKVSISNLSGDLYYYNGNYNQSNDGVNVEWSGFHGSKAQSGLGKTFTKYDLAEVNKPNAQDPFNMDTAYPSSRYLFYFVVESSFPNPVNINLQVLFTAQTATGTGQTDNALTAPNNLIYLTNAIYMYAPLAGETLMTFTDEATAATDVLNWLDTNYLLRSGSKQDVYDKNVFIPSGNRNVQTSGTTPSLLCEYTLQPNTKYIIPYIIEFTDDPATFFEKNGQGYDRNPKGNSNVYYGMNFVIDSLQLALK